MTFRFPAVALALGLSIAVVGCGKDSPTTPSAVDPKFTATLNAANEVPAVTNADAGATGSVTITFHLTKDASGNITAATADFVAPFQGFPAGTTITGAHIHPGAAGTTGAVIWNTTITSGEVAVSATGTGTVNKLAIAPTDIAQAQAIINNPAGFYFNIHTSLNGGGAIRGQLVRTN